jgi:hypothetical protein
LYLSREDEEYLKFERFFRFDTFQPSEDWLNLREIMLPNMMILENVQSANNFDPMLSGRYARWMVNLDSTTHQTQASLLRLMNVGIIERPDDVETYGVRFDPINGGVRLRWFPCAVVVTDQEVAWNSVMSGDVEINTTLIVESTSARKFDDDPTIVRSSDDCPTEFPLQVQLQIKKETPIYLEIQHQATKDGWFLISDTWYPGWHAWVDDEHVSIHPADYLFRAMRVSKGTHRIVLRYQPFSFWFGVALSVSAWLVLILIWRRIR